ncbi:hypothetical protein COU20_01530 [Candidatus Kaiserbacteria bacterium CG10_big_fil_rev_8_21_14_0_10_59_10]|uniref:Aspartyl/glutamyl-tRNA(Asn/Gln) amidotransferase subunit C n=1 Tax=Candidatus Kaiserbacteria bacterium CG10_big_fil_rev_8_21_14_0_10_59_10 TaxID=1974612 RepID=A0A2H0U882_9BACT|nr:MAG: hypothetical protein COU20_01530 [Candidatus Kaiserbacteria bacterium CG10_big_fil_rev_8_21_14_0_10_59_10]
MTQVDIESLAKLARLEVSNEERSRMEEDIPAIVEFVETIQKAEADAPPSAGSTGSPHSHIGLQNVMREDENPHESGKFTERMLSGAPKVVDGRVAVRQVLKRSP